MVDAVKIEVINIENLIRVSAYINDREEGHAFILVKNNQSAELADIITRNNKYRNLGIGSKMIHKATKYLRTMKIKQLRGTMKGDVNRLRRFYGRLGFDISGENINLKIICTSSGLS